MPTKPVVTDPVPPKRPSIRRDTVEQDLEDLMLQKMMRNSIKHEENKAEIATEKLPTTGQKNSTNENSKNKKTAFLVSKKTLESLESSNQENANKTPIGKRRRHESYRILNFLSKIIFFFEKYYFQKSI